MILKKPLHLIRSTLAEWKGLRAESLATSMAFLFLLVSAWLPALLGRSMIAEVAGLHRLSLSPTPYFIPQQFPLLYILTPLISISAFLLFLSPAAVFLLAIGKVNGFSRWLVSSFGISLGISILGGTILKLALGTPLVEEVFLGFWITLSLLGWLLWVFRSRQEAVWPTPFWGRLETRRALWTLGMSYFGVVALLPKIFWENFNLDGVEAFEFGRSLIYHLFPYWEVHEGVFGFYQNFVLFSYPNHWFINLFGNVEAAARLPYLLYVAVIFSLLLLLIEKEERGPLGIVEEGALWLGLITFSIVQVFNTNYEPFFADLAENAATDTLLIVCFLSSIYFLLNNHRLGFWSFAFLSYLASPGGLLLLLGAFAAIFLLRSDAKRRYLRATFIVILLCFAAGWAYEWVYQPLALDGVKDQFSAFNLAKRLYPPNLGEFSRVNALLFPAGILPALSLVFIRRRDPTNWIVGGTAVIYFGVVYSQTWTSLHQFTPIMLFPLVVFWRLYRNGSTNWKRVLAPAVITTTLVSGYLSLPPHFEINQAVREFGSKTDYRIGDYEGRYPEAIRTGGAFYTLVPKDYRLQYPDQPWGSDANSLLYYALRDDSNEGDNYFILRESNVGPEEATEVGRVGEAVVYVRDLGEWEQDVNRDLPTISQSPLYEPMLRHTYEFFREYSEAQGQASRLEGFIGGKH